MQGDIVIVHGQLIVISGDFSLQRQLRGVKFLNRTGNMNSSSAPRSKLARYMLYIMDHQEYIIKLIIIL